MPILLYFSMPTYSTAAVVLKRINYGEADRLVTLLTEKYGRVTAIARGVRKPLSKLRGFLELFTYGDFRLAEGKTLHRLTLKSPGVGRRFRKIFQPRPK